MRHRGLFNQRTRDWRDRNQDMVKRYVREYYDKNREEIIARAKTQSAIRRVAVGFYSWATCLEVYGGRCTHCGKKGDLTVDHIVPISLGGSNWQHNIQPLYLSCNSSKGNDLGKEIDRFEAYLNRKPSTRMTATWSAAHSSASCRI